MASMGFGNRVFYACYTVFTTVTLSDEGTFQDLEVRCLLGE